MKARNVFVLLFGVVFSLSAYAAQPNAIEQAMYFHSQVKDDKQCKVEVKNGKIVFDDAITNPAQTCPDAFAWKKFIETIKSEFWANWAYDGYTYPAKPLSLCVDGQSGGGCCNPLSKKNPGYDNAEDPGQNCPYYPGEHQGKGVLVKGKPTFQLHSSVPATLAEGIATADPGRVIRQEMAEVVFRNRPMWQYTFENNLYNTNGLGNAFNMMQTSISNNSPYRAQTTQISYPVGSIMFKTDWLHEDEAKKLGLHQNKTHPYITMYMKSSVGDNDAPVFREGLHYLMAITAASKDLPNWHWYAIEHVDNLGRCDYIGCNDSFGYASPDTVPVGYKKNFTMPKVVSDGLKQPSPIFVTGKKYDDGNISPALESLFKQMGVGQTESTNPKVPSPNDNAWMSYRLKGTQVEWMTKDGVNTVLGNSVTEGGFVNTSSCLTCHGQAAVNASGAPAISSVGFSSKLNLLGYNQSSNGAPENSWYYIPGTNTPLNIQTDFVWGILFANPIDQ